MECHRRLDLIWDKVSKGLLSPIRLIKVAAVEEVLFSSTGTARCATNMEKIAHIEKQQDKSSRWVKGIVIALSGSAFVFVLTVVYNLFKAVAATPLP